jgi:hypothetical protein
MQELRLRSFKARGNFGEKQEIFTERQRCIEDTAAWDNWKKVHASAEYKHYHDKYAILSDMLSGCEDVKNLFSGHSRTYMNRDGGFGGELFADAFSATLCRNEECLALMRSFLPLSAAAFTELYERMMEKG